MELSWGQLANKLYKSAKVKRVPISGQFELTARCNLKCKMCYVCKSINDIDAMKLERTAEEWISIAKQARDEGMLFLLLTGGEVFLRKDFIYIYSELASMGFNIEIYTNATMITPEIAKILGRIPPSKVGITLYGASAETYEKVCGNGNAFNLAMQGIELLLAEGIKVWLKTTVIKDNVDDFEKIAEFANKKGIEFGTVSYVSPKRDSCGTSLEEIRLSPLELITFKERANNFLKNKVIQKAEMASDEFIDEEEVTKDNNVDPFNCTAGKCSFWITWDGRLTPCALMGKPYSLPFNNSFKSSWDEIQKLWSLIPSCSECIDCKYYDECMPCPARLQLETGGFNKSAPYLCQIMKLKYTEKEVMNDEGIC